MKKLLLILISLTSLHTASAQFCSARINLLSALTATAEVGLDIALTDNITLDIAARYNPLTTPRLALSHYGAEVGARYWLFENFVGHSLGSQVGWFNYDVGGEHYRYDGAGYTWGISYAYAWILSIHWNIALEAGGALCYSRDTQRDLTADDWAVEYIRHARRLTLIPHRIGVTLNYLF